MGAKLGSFHGRHGGTHSETARLITGRRHHAAHFRMPDQKLTVQEAVALYTTGSAYTSFEEGYKGKIKEGYLADFIVLSDDIFSIPEEEILSVKVGKTYLGGEPVYTR